MKTSPSGRARRRLVLIGFAIGVWIAVGVWAWRRFDAGDLRDRLSRAAATLDRERSLRGPALIEFGARDAAFVAALAWDPLDGARHAVLLRLVEWAERDSEAIEGGVRLVVLPVIADGADRDAPARVAALHRGGELLRVVREAGRRPVDAALVAAALDDADDADLAKALCDEELQIGARAVSHIAFGLGLGPGDALLNGEKVDAATVAADQAFAARWHADLVRLAAIVREIGGDAAQVQRRAMATPRGDLKGDRYLQWIVRRLRMRQG